MKKSEKKSEVEGVKKQQKVSIFIVFGISSESHCSCTLTSSVWRQKKNVSNWFFVLGSEEVCGENVEK